MKFLYRKTLLFTLAMPVFVWLLFAFSEYLYYQRQIPLVKLLLADFSGPVPAAGIQHEIMIRLLVASILVLSGLAVSCFASRLEQSETRWHNIFDNVIPICITDNAYRIITANRSYERIFGPVKTSDNNDIMCHDSRPGPKCRTYECPLYQIAELGKEVYTCESIKSEHGADHHYIVTATPFLDRHDRQTGIIETFQDITEQRRLAREREELIADLQKALEKVKLLSGFLPICSSCKKIRDDKGYWTQLESYIRNHSEAEFSHSICPVCAKKLYGYTADKDDAETSHP